MKVFVALVFVLVAVNARPSTDLARSYLLCREPTTSCSVWKLTELGVSNTMRILQDALRKGKLCGFTEDFSTTGTQIEVMSLRNYPRIIECSSIDYYSNHGVNFSFDLIEPEDFEREKRHIKQRRGYWGQTQSQYLNTDGGDGKAEAHSSSEGSHAVVSEFTE